MAKVCCVCGNMLEILVEMGVGELDNYLDDERKLCLCDKCTEHMRNMRLSIQTGNLSGVNKEKEYFETYLKANAVDDDAIEYLESILNTPIEPNTLEINTDKQTENLYRVNPMFKTTTGYNFEGYAIIEYKNIVTSEVVLGTGFLSELSSQLNDLIGTTSGTFENKLSKAKVMALNKVIEKATSIGANALIGVSYDMMTLSNNMLVVSVNGTAVIIGKIKEDCKP